MAGLWASPFSQLEAISKKDNFEYWVWLHPNCKNSQHDWQRHLEKLKKAGLNNLLVQVYTGGHALFQNQLLAEQPCDVLKTILPIAQNLDMYVHAWMWTLINPSRQLKQKHPEWYALNKLGQSTVDHPPYVGYYNWLCPGKSEVRQYLLKVVDALLQYDGLAGIHLDYIRFPDVILPPGIQPKYNLKQTEEQPQFDYCYCTDCQQAFKKTHGLNPFHLKNGDEAMLWKKFRENQITQIVKMLSQRVKKRGKIVSAAVFATPHLARKFVRQNWPTWPLDYVFPMIYHEFYNQSIDWILDASRQGVKAIGQNKKLISGLFLDHVPPGELKRAIGLARKAGATGVSFFAHGDLIQNPEYLNILTKIS